VKNCTVLETTPTVEAFTMSTASRTHFTTGELGDFLGAQAWKVARLFELGEVAEPPRVGGRRLIPQTMIAEIVDGLRRHGWLAAEEATPS
jgi:hypothetical protein